MNPESQYLLKWIKTGVIAGAACALAYFIRFLPVPSSVRVPGYFLFGPLLIISSLAVFRYLTREKKSVLSEIFLVNNGLAGAMVTLMFVVQSANIAHYRKLLRVETRPFDDEQIKMVMNAIFTVQGGIGMVWDIFICIGSIFLGCALIQRSRLEKVVGALGFLLGTLTLTFNFIAWPSVNPETVGLIDLGPYIAVWYVFVLLILVREWVVQRKPGN